MKPILSRRQMRALDAHAIQSARVPSIVLMENAGRGAADVIERGIAQRSSGYEKNGAAKSGSAKNGTAKNSVVLIVCGTGNNGGDGFVAARHLSLRGYATCVVLAGAAEKLSNDARTNHEAWVHTGGKVDVVDSPAKLDLLKRAVAGAAVIVDALFGTGLDRPLEAFHKDVIAIVNSANAWRVALDIPSGLCADTGLILGTVVRAHETVTFGEHKLGLLTPNGADLCGEITVKDIGVSHDFWKHVGSTAYLLDDEDAARAIQPRSPSTHKTKAGHLAVVAGSPGKLGASLLVAHGGMRSGAGLVTIVTWSKSASVLDSRVLEVMTARIEAANVQDSIDEALAGKKAVVVGPGFGLDADAELAVQHILSTFPGPVVVDADALTHFAKMKRVARKAPTIFTPHAGEAARLLNTTADKVEADRYAAVRELVHGTGGVVVLKGAHTIVGSPSGDVFVSAEKVPALATAGAGDVLGGVIGALSLSLSPFEAAWVGVHLHANAAKAWSARHSDARSGLVAHEIADEIPAIIGALPSAHSRGTA